MKPKYEGRFGDSLVYRMGECGILLSGPEERKEVGWHLSISHPTRNPTWEEQKNARYELIPDEVYMVSILPPKSEYLNVHSFCFHWYEMDKANFSPAAVL